uniref:Putative enoyl-coa hydratase/isomerase n=1 Tax=Ixodes ricinus TaxID=34613 RepID=A0A090XAX7_IXORI
MLGLSRRALWNPSVCRASAALRLFSAAFAIGEVQPGREGSRTMFPRNLPTTSNFNCTLSSSRLRLASANVAKPDTFDFVGKAKWDAWNNLGDMSQDDAQNEYAAIRDEAGGNEGIRSCTVPGGGGSVVFVAWKGLVTYVSRWRLHYSASTGRARGNSTYVRDVRRGDQAAEGCRAEGRRQVSSCSPERARCSRADSTSTTSPKRMQMEPAKEAVELLRRYVAEFINFPKPAIALVNGPSIGVACTILGLFDIVYASDKAFF